MSCTPPKLTVIGTVGDTWQVDVLLSTKNPMFELCYQNVGEAAVIVPSNFCPDPIAFSASFTSGGSWTYGAKAGAVVWVNQYCPTVPYYMGSYFTDLYNSVKGDRSSWVLSNEITVASLPGTSAGKKNKPH